MKCGRCVEQGLKSRLHSHGGTKTLMGWSPYYDEDGVFHKHDPNLMTKYYQCSNGHRMVVKDCAQCPTEGCDYGRDSEEVIFLEQEKS